MDPSDTISGMTATLLTGTDSLIERNPDRWGGRPLIAGTGVTVQKIGDLWNEGMSAEQIWDQWDGRLSKAQVYAALAYYLVNREWFDADLLLQAELHQSA